jgi:lipoate-protein ligase A
MTCVLPYNSLMSDEKAWRVLTDPPAGGAWNMAVDEAILETVSAADSPPTLRLYRWEPACLSLGYGQRYREVDEGGLLARGWDVVRRPTGGQAILHTDELTYSVTAPADHPLVAGGVLPSYRRIAAALQRGLEKLAVPAVARERYAPAGLGKGPVCFETPSDWEITWEGRKLVGSAQVRRRAGVLQHGTIPLYGDLGRITEALSFDSNAEKAEAARRVREQAATVEAALGRRASWEEAAGAVLQGFLECLEVKIHPGELTQTEIAAAHRLETEKYGSPVWTKRR